MLKRKTPILTGLAIGLLVSGLSPAIADLLKDLKVPEGLEVTVWAESPLFHNPTGMDVDERGRIWVSEAVNYRGFRNKAKNGLWHKGGDRIMILEDTDGDGKADHSKVFVQDTDLVAPLGVAVIGDKVVVSASPNLIVYTRDEHDAVVKKEILLTGWGGLDHDHSLHKIECGPDGRWYINAGNAGPHQVTDKSGWSLRSGSWYAGGSPYNKKNTPGLKSDDGRIYSGGLICSVLPDGSDMKVWGHGYRNPYGHALDSFGNVWMNDNDDTQSCRSTWIMRFSDLGYCSKDGARSWRADQRPGQSVRSAHWRQDDPGVIPSGHVYGNGSPTGLCYYEHGALGSAYAGGLLLSCEAGQNVVWAYHRKVEGAGYALEGFPLLTSTGVQDPNYTWHKAEKSQKMWFRPSDVIVGTDGAVYVADWFDAVVGGHQMSDKEGLGTIYRIAAKREQKTSGAYKAPIDFVKSPAVNVRAQGIHDLSDDEVKELLSDENRFIRARGVWALGRKQQVSQLHELLDDADPEIRLVAYRALIAAGDDHLRLAARMATDPSAAVHREVALSMRDVPYASAKDVLSVLAASYVAGDRWFLEALGTACDGKALEMYARLLGQLGAASGVWSPAFADIAWRLHPVTAIPAFTDRAQNPSLSVDARKQAIDALAFIPHKNAATAMLAIAQKGPEDHRAYAAYWVKHRANNDWKGFGVNVAKTKPAVAPKAKASRPLPGKMHYTSKVLKKGFVDVELDITGAANLALIVTDAGNGRSCDWADWINPVLVDAEGREHRLTGMNIAASEVGWFTLGVGKNCNGGALTVGGKSYEDGFGAHAPSRLDFALPGQRFVTFKARAAVDDGSLKDGGALHLSKAASVVFQVAHDGASFALPGVADVVKLKGDAKLGEKLFHGAGACFSCHQFDGKGRDVGPDLSQIKAKFDAAGLVDAIMNPNSGILVGYETYLVTTKDGKSHFGFILADGEYVLMKNAAGQQVVIEKDQILKREAQAFSLMPKLPLHAQQVADLSAYLRKLP